MEIDVATAVFQVQEISEEMWAALRWSSGVFCKASPCCCGERAMHMFFAGQARINQYKSEHFDILNRKIPQTITSGKSSEPSTSMTLGVPAVNFPGCFLFTAPRNSNITKKQLEQNYNKASFFDAPKIFCTWVKHSPHFKSKDVSNMYQIHHPNAPCADYLPTSGETWPHSMGNVGNCPIHGASGSNIIGNFH